MSTGSSCNKDSSPVKATSPLSHDSSSTSESTNGSLGEDSNFKIEEL